MVDTFLRLSDCLSACLSHAEVYRIKMTQSRLTRSSLTLIFVRPGSVGIHKGSSQAKALNEIGLKRRCCISKAVQDRIEAGIGLDESYWSVRLMIPMSECCAWQWRW